MITTKQQSISPEYLMTQARISVLHYVRAFCKEAFTKEDIEDMIEDVIYKALRSAESYSPEKGAYSTWIGAISLNTVRGALKGLHRRRAFFAGSVEDVIYKEASEDFADKHLLQAEKKEVVLSKALTERDRAIVRMRIEGYDSEKVADELGIPTAIVYKAVHRVKSRLDLAA